MQNKNLVKTNNIHSRKSSDKTWWIIALVLVFMIGFCLGDRSHSVLNSVGKVLGFKLTSTELDYSKLDEIYRQLKQKYDGKINPKELIEGANKGLTAALGDRYTTYLTAKEAEEFNKSLSGEIGGGIGAEIGIRKGLVTIIRPLKDNPAFLAGIKAGDVLHKVNDEEISNQSLEQVIQKVRGKPGTQVKLTVVRKGEAKPIDITVTRKIISNPSVTVEYKGDVAIMTVSRFDKKTAELASQLAEQIKQKSIKKIILDLRGNSGGYLTAARELASLWLSNKLVVSEKAGGKTVQELYAQNGNDKFSGLKTVVLMNNGSASASEIVIGALKDHKKATLIGETTFGKGSVQELIDLKDGGQLKVTIARWYTPNGQNIDKEGIKPDKEVELSADDWQNGRDPQLQAALEALK